MLGQHKLGNYILGGAICVWYFITIERWVEADVHLLPTVYRARGMKGVTLDHPSIVVH